jgi:DNA helicase HerA-like ATPase
MSGTISMKKKRLAVAHVAGKLFEARRSNKVPPFLLILEEAHQYVPEKVQREHAICRGILQTIAREGRKFHASLCLISQRPVQLSTTVLSQCNTNIILRVTNPYDLKHIGESSEGITKDVQDQISSLQVGTGLVVGEAVNFPLFVKIRKRKSKESEKGLPLEQAALAYMKDQEQKKSDAKEFM